MAIRNTIVAKKTTELVLLFHKNISKLVLAQLEPKTLQSVNDMRR